MYNGGLILLLRQGNYTMPVGRITEETATPARPPIRSIADLPTQRTDEALLAHYLEGDRQSFEQLVGRYQRELYHFLVRFMGDRVLADDVFQETFLQVHQSAGRFDLTRRFRPWLFTIAANKARDFIRSNNRRQTTALQAVMSSEQTGGEFINLIAAEGDAPGERLEKHELQQKVQRTIAAMPEHLREILLLSYFHQFPYKIISDMLDIPLGTVKSRLHSAVGQFAERWRNLEKNLNRA